MSQAPKTDAAQTASFGFRDVAAEEKARLVRRVFDHVAGRYDLMNDLMSLGVHRAWKDMMAARVNPQPGETIIDIASGTGDIARRLGRLAEAARARRGGRAARILVTDINEDMLMAGRARGAETGLAWAAADAERLPIADRMADALTVAFGVRNMTDIPAALADMRRVLKPGGRFFCLEFSKPATAAFEKLYETWSFEAIPRIGRLAANDEDSYRYLVESIRRFPDQNAFAGLIKAAGLARVGYQNYSGGVAALHWGWRV